MSEHPVGGSWNTPAAPFEGGKTSLLERYPGFNIELHPVMRVKFWSSVLCVFTISLPFLSSPLRARR